MADCLRHALIGSPGSELDRELDAMSVHEALTDAGARSVTTYVSGETVHTEWYGGGCEFLRALLPGRVVVAVVDR